MSDIHLHALALRNAEWLSARQALVAGNVANVNTPGFKTRDLKPFNELADPSSVEIRTTKALHLSSAETSGLNSSGQSGKHWETNHSGGNVSLPKEMIKASEIATQYQLNTNLMRSFHRMVVAAFGA